MRILFATAAAGMMLAGSASATNLPGMQSTIKYSTTSTGASGYTNYARATSKVVFDPATNTYTVRDTGSLTTTATFGPANQTSSNATFTTYGTSTNSFRRLNLSASNPLIVLTYVDYGQWRRTGTANGVTSVNDTYLVFGQKTPAANVPRTGSASYTTIVDGTFVNKNGAYAVSGNGSLVANFAGGTISYSETATGTKEVGIGSINFGTMNGTGSIAFNSAGFSGTGTSDTQGYRMDVNGFFYGPAAQEVGGLFRITGNGGQGQGALVGHQ